MVGSLSFAPPLVLGGTSATTVKWKATLSGCTDADNPAVAGSPNSGVYVQTGSAAGTLTGTSNDCTLLSGVNPMVGALLIKWKVVKNYPGLVQTSSTLNITSMGGGVSAAMGGWAGQYGEFQIGTTFGTGTPNITAGGGFRGGDSGHNSTLDAVTGQDIGSLATSCVIPGGGGIKTANFGIGALTLG